MGYAEKAKAKGTKKRGRVSKSKKACSDEEAKPTLVQTKDGFTLLESFIRAGS